MNNQEIIEQIKLYASILELEGENVFKIRSYHTAVRHIEVLESNLSEMTLKEIEGLQGIGKAIASKIDDAKVNGTFRQLKEKLETVPSGVIEMLSIDGLGVKKVRQLWKDLGIENIDQLLQACENNQIAETKGFGAKTQENIKQSLLYKKAVSDKLRWANAEVFALQMADYLKKESLEFEIVGEIRRQTNLVNQIDIIVKTDNLDEAFEGLDKCNFVEKDEKATGLFTWRGKFKENSLKVNINFAKAEQFYSEVFIQTASIEHLNYTPENLNKTLLQVAQKSSFDSEKAIYDKANLPYIAPELREGLHEFALAEKNQIPDLLELSDIKGILHAHSTYSDGKNTLEDMALACQKLGYEYLGITDHSKSAFYANGLQEYHIEEQHKEIDQLNAKLQNFRIFKGIESDILADGSLDYEDSILKKFDFIIASIHSSLKMDEEKATKRLIKAIENPYTTMLGHPTGRILLRRKGYDINYEKVIEACAKNHVLIEINASPYRLDLDWKWVKVAIDKGVMLSINPDAHNIKGIEDVRYGINVARKGFLTKKGTLNTLKLDDIELFFKERLQKRIKI